MLTSITDLVVVMALWTGSMVGMFFVGGHVQKNTVQMPEYTPEEPPAEPEDRRGRWNPRNLMDPVSTEDQYKAVEQVITAQQRIAMMREMED